MTDILKTMSASTGGMQAQSARMRISAENLANADTPGYRRKLIPFRQVLSDQGAATVRPGRMYLDSRELNMINDPAHPLAGPNGMYEGSNVNAMIEIADAREAQRSYEANLKMFDQARQMTTSLLQLLRR